jgi:hypothetical protein
VTHVFAQSGLVCSSLIYASCINWDYRCTTNSPIVLVDTESH